MFCPPARSAPGEWSRLHQRAAQKARAGEGLQQGTKRARLLVTLRPARYLDLDSPVRATAQIPSSEACQISHHARPPSQ